MRTVPRRDVCARRAARAGWLALGALLLLLLYRAAPIAAQTGGQISISPTTATVGTSTSFVGVITTGSGYTSGSWTFSDTGGSVPASSTSSNVTTVSHVFATAGTYEVIANASGGTNGTVTGFTQVTVSGAGGTGGQITISPTSGSPNVPVTFVATTPAQASSATVIWSFGDNNNPANNTFTGTISNTSIATATHTYPSAGTYTVTVTEYGSALGGTSINYTGSTSIVIGGGSGTSTGNGAFQVTAGNGNYLGIAGTPINFFGNAQCNTNAQCSGNFNYNWTFSDGTSSGASTANRSYSKTFSNAGTYTATFSATDLTYNTTNSASQQVCVAPSGGSTSNNCGSTNTNNTTTGSGQVTSNGLTVNPGGPYSGSGGTAINFTATATSANSNATIVSYVWSFGDGSSGSGQTTTHTYNSSGNFTVALTVTDSTGVAVTATTTAQIAAGQRKLNLPQGCTNVASTFPDATSTGTIVSNVSPTSAVLSVWEFNSALAKFQGYLPGATQATDLPTINHLDAFFICVNAAATFSEPSA